MSIYKEKLERNVTYTPWQEWKVWKPSPDTGEQRDGQSTYTGKKTRSTYVWVSGPRPRSQHSPQESREAPPRPCQEEGRAGVGGALTGGAPEQSLWEAFVAPAVQHLHGINGGDFRRLSPKTVCPPTDDRRPSLTRASKITSWHQIQPHPAPNPTTPSTKSSLMAPNPATPGARSDHIQYQIQQHSVPKSTSLRIKFNHTCHEVQPHPVSNPTTLGTKLRLTVHQIQPHLPTNPATPGIQFKLTRHQIPPHSHFNILHTQCLLLEPL